MVNLVVNFNPVHKKLALHGTAALDLSGIEYYSINEAFLYAYPDPQT